VLLDQDARRNGVHMAFGELTNMAASTAGHDRRPHRTGDRAERSKTKHDVDEGKYTGPLKTGLLTLRWPKRPLDDFRAEIGRSVERDQRRCDEEGNRIRLAGWSLAVGSVPARRRWLLHPDGPEFEVIDAGSPPDQSGCVWRMAEFSTEMTLRQVTAWNAVSGSRCLPAFGRGLGAGRTAPAVKARIRSTHTVHPDHLERSHRDLPALLICAGFWLAALAACC